MQKHSREYDKRKYWKLWNHSSLIETCQQKVRYWDDPEIDPQILASTRWFCGVEVHKLNIVLAFYGIADGYNLLGPIQSYDYTYQGLPVLATFASQFHPYRFLMETTGIFHYQITWFLKEQFPAAQVIVMNARLVSHHLERTRKSDPIDAARLAQLARYDELLKPSYVPTPHQAILRDLTRQRSKVVSESTKLKNRIKKLLAMYGFKWNFNFQQQTEMEMLFEFCQSHSSFGVFLHSNTSQKWRSYILDNMATLRPWTSFNPSQEVRITIDFLIKRLKLIECDQSAVEAQIQQRVLPDLIMTQSVPLIANMPGFGAVGIPELIMEIGDIHRFPSAGHFLVYAGIGPHGGTSGVKQLGDKVEKVVEKDHPPKYCNFRIKTILVRAAKVVCSMAKKSKSKDEIVVYARQVLKKKLQKFPTFFKVAAKMGRRMFYCLQHGVIYQERVTIPVVKPSLKSRRKREAKIKAILQQKYTEIWQNSQQMFRELEALQIPPAQIQNLMTLLYTGRFGSTAELTVQD